MAKYGESFESSDSHLVFRYAEHKSRYGHRDWVIWQQKDGSFRTELKTKSSLKAALIATGTQGEFWLQAASWRGATQVMRWWMGINALNQLRWGI